MARLRRYFRYLRYCVGKTDLTAARLGLLRERTVMLIQGGTMALRTARRAGTALALVVAALLGGGPPAAASIINVMSNQPVHVTTPAAGTVVTTNFLVNNNLAPAIAFNEQQGVTLSTGLFTDTGVIAAGTVVNSQYIAFNARQTHLGVTVIKVEGPVLGLEFSGFGLGKSDFLGLSTLAYLDNCSGCGLEAGQDHISFSGDSVLIHNVFGSTGDFVRIISLGASSGTIPEPNVLAVIMTGAFLAFVVGRLRRS